MAIETAPRALAAEATAGVLADQHDVRRRDADPIREGRARGGNALGGAVQEQLAVLPVRHRAARFKRVMTGGLHDKGLVEHQRRLFKARVEIAEGPLPQAACLSAAGPSRAAAKSASVHFTVSRVGGAGGPGGAPGLAAAARSRHCRRVARSASRPEAFERIDDEGQRLEVDDDAFDGVGGSRPRRRRQRRGSARRRRTARWSARFSPPSAGSAGRRP